MSRLEKAIAKAKSIQETQKILNEDPDLIKGVHDAMYHHAVHTRAAERHGKKEAAKKHMHMFLKHAVDNVKDRDSYGQKSGIQNSVRHYIDDEAYNDMPYGADGDKHPACKHFKDSDDFVPHAHDGKLGHGKEKKGGKE